MRKRDWCCGAIATLPRFSPSWCGSESSPEKTAWPKIKLVHSLEARALIKRVQPFNRLRSNDPLWVLHQLDIIDKHHVLIVAVGTTKFWRGSNPDGSVPLEDEAGLIPVYIPLKDGAIVAKPLYPPINTAVFESNEEVVLPKIGRINAEPIVVRLQHASGYVRALISTFEPFA